MVYLYDPAGIRRLKSAIRTASPEPPADAALSAIPAQLRELEEGMHELRQAVVQPPEDEPPVELGSEDLGLA